MSHPIPPSSPTLSTTSSTASTTATVIDTSPNPKSIANLWKQLKYLSIGLVLMLYFQVPQHISDALSLGVLSSSSAKLAALSLALLAGTVLMFTYVILLPARGFAVNYVEWRRDERLGSAIPVLTGCIIVGWTVLLITLSPVGAPAPPAVGVKQRLAQAAKYTGVDLASIPHNLWTSEKSWDILSSKSSSKQTAESLQKYLAQLSTRADEWSAQNIKVIGWTGAVLGSIGTYLTVFGGVGLIGFIAPDRRTKHKTF
ncbi:hypothetical protein PHSY_001452 [Pseudozyma hubeiensis SY62]|uniref:Uncharacterized protein n=1 Tax=Pseudozyma hubeiensis (strain SY62) TaxID=1305764 RepID=R9P736_PSEHS|nr:hypothetical protein PHSY_001452 [Pseudozyma hubeiensis SY62]GAC93885.1 hypothetical protein PHSY_001452 [Pseudozyma hubeiensis SY62]